MKSFWALYKRDLRQIWAICLALIVFGIVWDVIRGMMSLYVTQHQLFGNLEKLLDWERYTLYRMANHMRGAMSYFFSIVLAILLYQNHRSDSRYQIVSLPVSRGVSLLSGFAALMTYVAVYSFFSAATSSIFMELRYRESLQRLPAHILSTLDHGTGSLMRSYILSVLREFMHSGHLYGFLLYSGMVCLAAGIMGARRGVSRFMYWAGFCGVFLAINVTIMTMFAFFENLELDWLDSLSIYIMLFTGFALTTIGAYLYHRHAEV